MSDTGPRREEQRAREIRDELLRRGLVATRPYVEIVEDLVDSNERVSDALAKERAARDRDRKAQTAKATMTRKDVARNLLQLAVKLKADKVPVPRMVGPLTNLRDDLDHAAGRRPKLKPISEGTIYTWFRNAGLSRGRSRKPRSD